MKGVPADYHAKHLRHQLTKSLIVMRESLQVTSFLFISSYQHYFTKHKTCAIYLPTLFLKTLNIYSVHYLLTNIISQNIKHLQYALPTFQHYFTKHKTFTVCATYLPTFFHKTLKTITFSIRESWLQNSSTMVTQMENLWNRCWMTVLLHLILT